MKSAARAAVMVLLLLGPAVRAADEPGSARDHFKKGQTHYSLGEFNEAVTEFREAYRLKNEPAILFNIAQAMRQVGQYKQAYFYYSQYLHQRPDAPNRPEVEGFMASMKKKVEADDDAEKARSEADTAKPGAAHYPEDHLVDGQEEKPGRAAVPAGGAGSGVPAGLPKAAPSVPASAATAVALASTKTNPKPAAARPPAVPAPALQAAPEPGHPDRAAHIAGYSALGAGALAGGLAFVFHSGAQSAADELNQKYANGTLTASDAHLKSDVDSQGKLATFAAVGAGVLIAAGAVLAFAF